MLLVSLLAMVAQLVPSQPAETLGDRWTSEALVYRLAGPSVVSVYVSIEKRSRRGNGVIRTEQVNVGQGTGVIIDSRGLVITNAHVVAPKVQGLPTSMMTVEVAFADEFGGGMYRADLLSIDRDQDLALLKIKSEKVFPAVVLGSSKDVIIGEKVIAIGAPYGNSHSITSGILSGNHRKVTVSLQRGVQTFVDLLQTDAAINPGNSGGPLLDIYGRLIGINVATNENADGLGFAIPVDRVRETLSESLLDFGKSLRYWMDVSFEEKDETLFVQALHPRGPAQQAGVRVGDQLREIQGKKLTGMEELSAFMVSQQAGNRMELELLRDGEKRVISFTLLPPESRDSFAFLGFGTVQDRIRLQSRFGFRTQVVLRVAEVYPDSPAQKLGLLADDIVIAVRLDATQGRDGWVQVRSQEELLALMRSPSFRNDAENIWIIRDEESFYGEFSTDATVF